MSAYSWSTRVLLLSAAVLGCDASTGPGVVTSTYVLRQVAGDPLPALLATTEFVKVRVHSDTLRLQSGGIGTSSGVMEVIPLVPDLPAEGPRPAAVALHYKLEGNRVEITYDCPPEANCVRAPTLTGTLDDAVIRLSWVPWLDGRDPLEYVRTER